MFQQAETPIQILPDLDLIPDLELDPKLTAGLYLLVDPKQKVTLSANTERLAAKAH
jgi:hypothetical protein